MSVSGFIKGIFSTPKLVDNVFDMEKGLLTQVGQWAGRQSLSAEESIIHNDGMVKAVQAYSVATLAENTDRSVARRTIAVNWLILQVWLIKLNVLCVFVDYLIIEVRGGDSSLTGSIADIAFSPMLWGITGAVSVFFFGSHVLRSTKLSK